MYVSPQNVAGLAIHKREVLNAEALVTERKFRYGPDDARTIAAKVVASDVAAQWFTFFREA